MPKSTQDDDREERITLEIVVDAYGPEEQAMGWYYTWRTTGSFPLTPSASASAAFLLCKQERRLKDYAWPRNQNVGGKCL